MIVAILHTAPRVGVAASERDIEIHVVPSHGALGGEFRLDVWIVDLAERPHARERGPREFVELTVDLDRIERAPGAIKRYIAGLRGERGAHKKKQIEFVH